MNHSADIVDDCFLSENIVISILAICSVIAFCLNAAVILSIFWIRRPLTPILKMSLGLAAADILSSVTMVFPKYIPPKTQLNWNLIFQVVYSIGLIITVAHLLALSLNHYIGIMKPLHYNSIMTSKKVSLLIAVLWILPIAFILIIYSVVSHGKFWEDIFSRNQDYYIGLPNETMIDTIENSTQRLNSTDEDCDETKHYLYMFSLRMGFSTLLIVPIILMTFFYIHILIVVRRQQKKWKELSRSGSRKYRGKMTRLNDERSHRNLQSEQRQLEGNVKAIYTTFLIMGSCFIGWMPAVMLYVHFCRCDCFIKGEKLDDLNRMYKCEITNVRFVENLLIIIKMCINPIIYSMRMKEIREGRTRMYWAFMRLFCPSRRNSSNYNLACQRSPNHNSGVSVQVRVTSLRTNGIGNYHNNQMKHVMLEPISNTLL